MNNITPTITQNVNTFTNWVDETSTPQIIDTVTYDLYESSNPFRKTFTEHDVNNKAFRLVLNTSSNIGAELFSLFSNPYYLTHKITSIPVAYKSVVDTYQKNSQPLE